MVFPFTKYQKIFPFTKYFLSLFLYQLYQNDYIMLLDRQIAKSNRRVRKYILQSKRKEVTLHPHKNQRYNCTSNLEVTPIFPKAIISITLHIVPIYQQTPEDITIPIQKLLFRQIQIPHLACSLLSRILMGPMSSS